MLDLGCQNSIDVIRQFVPLGGRQVIDAGCGDLSLAGELANSGACVLAIDPDPEQARINRAQNSIEGVEFAETGAEKIPLPSASAAGVFFSYSLHHVPGAMYAAVFDEVFRVLDGDGFLMVIEPVSCPLYDDVVKRFHDEDHARAAAWNALAKLAIPRFERVEDVTFHKWVEYESFDHFVQRFASRSFNSIYSESDIRCEAVEAAFLRVGGSGHRFHANSRALILQGLRSVQSSLRGEPGR